MFSASRHLYGALCISGMAEALLGYLDVLLAGAGKLSRTLVNTSAGAAAKNGG